MAEYTKTVPLTDEQYDMLWQKFHAIEKLSEIVAEAVMHIAETQAKNERNAWRSVHQLAETDESKDVQIDWLNRCINVP